MTDHTLAQPKVYRRANMQILSETSKAAAERVASILRDRIVKGDLAPLDRLVERRLSAELDVSRTPVREALKLLEADGLIEITLHRGALVSVFGPDEAVHLFDVISSLESLAAERLAETITPDSLQKLEDLHGTMLEQFRSDRISDYFDTNTLIHDFIVTSCGNPIVIATHNRLIARARRGRYMAIMNPERLEQAVGEHETLMQAFRSRDPLAAAKIWKTHLLHTGETLAAVLVRQGDRNPG
jgi:DNA-binding GntR family transcriptional regulator